MNSSITSHQSSAVRCVTDRKPSADIDTRAITYLQRWLGGGLDVPDVNSAPLTINFHPDRPTKHGDTVIDSILASGRIQNQFESASSNGFLIGSKGNVRVRREAVLFGRAYDDAHPAARPKYGAVNLFASSRGGWPRFGSCYWVLDRSVVPRCTVTVPGSLASRAWWGSYSNLTTLMSELCVRTGSNPPEQRFRLIDGPVELQIHGDIALGRDVTALVLDPSFRGTSVETTANRISDIFGVSVEWAPELGSTGVDWKTSSARSHARQRILGAVNSGEMITAAWIGRDLWSQRSRSAAAAIADGACRYLWNRLLLTQQGAVLTQTPALSLSRYGPEPML